MLIIKKCLPFLLILVLMLAACNLVESPPTEPVETAPPVTGDEPVAAMTDLTGMWTGQLTETSGQVWDMTLSLVHTPPGTSVSGTLEHQAGSFTESFPVTGTFDGTTLHLQTTGYTTNLTATYAAGTLTGYEATGCFDCPASAFGNFVLTRAPTGSDAPPAGETTVDLSGTWTGTLTENTGTVRIMTLVLFQTPPYTEITGTVDLVTESMHESYDISGGIEGIILHVQTSGYGSGLEIYLTATYNSGTPEILNGNAAFNCYECPASSFGSFTLTRGAPGSSVPPAGTTGDIFGTWTGTAVETSGALRTFNVTLVIDPAYSSPPTYYYGTIDLTFPDGSYFQHYLLNITLSGSDIQMTDSGSEVITQYIWGSVFENSMMGHMSADGFELNPWASFSLTR